MWPPVFPELASLCRAVTPRCVLASPSDCVARRKKLPVVVVELISVVFQLGFPLRHLHLPPPLPQGHPKCPSWRIACLRRRGHPGRTSRSSRFPSDILGGMLPAESCGTSHLMPSAPGTARWVACKQHLFAEAHTSLLCFCYTQNFVLVMCVRL